MTESTAVTPRINPAQYRELTSFDDALALAQAQYGNIEAASSAIGDGFELLSTDQKQQLVGVPLLILSFSFAKSEVGDKGEFVTARVVTQAGRKAVLNDGSTGVYQQLKDYQRETGRDGGLLVQRGLRKSEYTYEETQSDGTTRTKPASTYYIDTAA